MMPGMVVFARFSLLLLMLLAVFTGQPVEHGADDCHGALCLVGASCCAGDSEVVHMCAAHEGGHRHMPCIHLTEGDELTQGSELNRTLFCPPLRESSFWHRGVNGQQSMMLCGRSVSPTAGVCLPMLC